MEVNVLEGFGNHILHRLGGEWETLWTAGERGSSAEDLDSKEGHHEENRDELHDETVSGDPLLR